MRYMDFIQTKEARKLYDKYYEQSMIRTGDTEPSLPCFVMLLLEDVARLKTKIKKLEERNEHGNNIHD